MKDFPLVAASGPALQVLVTDGSTNTEMVARLARNVLPDYAAVITDDQTGGRGRLGRSWLAPAGASMAVSVVLPQVPSERSGWVALAAGIAMTDAVTAELPGRAVGFKWPNDVLVGHRKVCGILAELTVDGRIVVGAGLNVAMTVNQLPVPTATSLAIEGASEDGAADRVIALYLQALRDLIDRYLAAGADPNASGLRAAAVERCVTLGRRVTVESPRGSTAGIARDLDSSGHLLVQADDGTVAAISVGDVIHVR